MISVGIDVSKEKSTVCFLKPGGEVVKTPYDVMNNKAELGALVERIKSFDEEVRVVLEDTGHYHFPVVKFLMDNGIFVSTVNALRMKNTVLRILEKPRQTALILLESLRTELHIGVNLFPHRL